MLDIMTKSDLMWMHLQGWEVYKVNAGDMRALLKGAVTDHSPVAKIGYNEGVRGHNWTAFMVQTDDRNIIIVRGTHNLPSFAKNFPQVLLTEYEDRERQERTHDEYGLNLNFKRFIALLPK